MTRVHVCSTSDLPPGEMTTVAGSETVAVCNIDGTVHAFADQCTHAEASLSEGWLEGDEVVCPFHFGRFSVVTGAATCLPAEIPLRTYPVVVEGDEVFVELD